MGITESTSSHREPNLGLANSEVREEKLHQKLSFISAQCDSCLLEPRVSKRRNTALYICYDCQVYLCDGCFRRHEYHKGRENHNFVKLGSDENEAETKTDKLIDDLLNESDSWDKLKSEDKTLCDKVNVKHSLDSHECGIVGICGFEKAWIACDSNNSCLKVFQLGSNTLDRYIKLWSSPWGATEIKIRGNNKPSFENEISRDRTNAKKKVTNEPTERSVLAVTLPMVSKILILDLNEVPITNHSVIKTPIGCFGIAYSDDKIFTTSIRNSKLKCSIYIMSTDGEILNEIKTGITSIMSYIAVKERKIYLPDFKNKAVRCFHIDKIGSLEAVTEISEGSEVFGISLDDQNIYLGTLTNLKWCKLRPHIPGSRLLTDTIIQSVENPMSICCYRDKIFVSHMVKYSMGNFVTIIRCT